MITISPRDISFWIEPVVPTLIKVLTPILAASSIAIAREGPPIPVDRADISIPLNLPVADLYSLWKDKIFPSSHVFKILSTLPGSPGVKR